MCINLSSVPAAVAKQLKPLDKEGAKDGGPDGKVCVSEVPGKDEKGFMAFVTSVRTDFPIEVNGKPILRSQLVALNKLAKDNSMTLAEVLKKAVIKDGYVHSLDFLKESRFKNVSAIQAMTKLWKLDASLSGLNDLNQIDWTKLTNLGVLMLYKTDTSDISPLQGTNLWRLSVSGTKVTNFSSVAKIPTLRDFYATTLRGTIPKGGIDLTPLQGALITTLYLGNNPEKTFKNPKSVLDILPEQGTFNAVNSKDFTDGILAELALKGVDVVWF